MLLLLLLGTCKLSGQSIPPAFKSSTITGAPFIVNYTPEDYKAHNQNWAIAQDARGVMFFGNTEGLLEYDGVSWRILNTDIVRSMDVAADGQIYIGGFGQFGYLQPDSVQKLQFVSLLPHLDEKYHEFPDVWQTLATSEGIYFVTPKYIFRWDHSNMKVWDTPTSFHVGFVVNDKFYIRHTGVGLMQIIEDSLTLLPLGEKLADERVMSMFPYPAGGNNSFLLGTRNNGLLLYNGVTIEPFTNEAHDILIEGQLYCGAQLENGHYAFGTLQNGVVIIDAGGKLVHHLNKATGLQDETIWYLFQDRQGGLWIGMHVGISRAEISSPITYFGEREGLEGSVLEMVRYQGILYAATSMGIYYLDDRYAGTGGHLKFKRVSGVSPQCWALLPFGDVLLAAAFDGVYAIRGNEGRLINSTNAMSLHRSKQDSNRIFVGLPSGFKSLFFSRDQWKDEGLVSKLENEILHIHESSPGILWLTARFNGLMLVDMSDGFTSSPVAIKYDTTHGLPDGERNVAFNTSRGIRFATSRGVYQFDNLQQRFYPDTSLIRGLPDPNVALFSINEDKNRNLWIVAQGELLFTLRQNDGTYEFQPSAFLRIADLDDYYVYPDPSMNNITWLGCIDRVIRYNGNVPKPDSSGFLTLIRQINIRSDSLLYGGTGSAVGKKLILSSTYKSVRISFAAPTFDEESKTLYQHILEGYDEKWSDWSHETYKDFTGLPQGNYRFVVRSKNIYDQIGDTASVEFRILPPFYLTWWAFLIYVILFAAIVFLLWQQKMARVQKVHLGELKQVEFEKLKELDQLKSRFFANISHEFRTPLTLILGPIDNLLTKNTDKEDVRQFHLIKRNAQRLLRLINQLLDLSKLEAGKMKLEKSLIDIIPFIKGIAHSFESLMQGKKLNLEFRSEVESAILHIDPDKMEQILTNLIFNAVKFTLPGGSVIIDIKLPDDNRIQIDVVDTGSGIAEDQLQHVFDRFYQGTEASRSAEPGSGIGLALTKELVELHQGSIQVNSKVNEGTIFSIVLPYEKDPANLTDPSSKLNGHPSVIAVDMTLESSSILTEQDLGADNTLLLVEDNADLRLFVRDTLRPYYRVIEAVDGQDGIEKAFEFIPDIIISDVMMPIKDGLQLCEVLKKDERTSHIPVVLLTAKADIESRLAGLERGADDYLAKPFNKEELLIRSRNLLDLRQNLRQRYSSLEPIPTAQDKNILIEDAFLLKIRALVESNLSDSELEIDDIARQINMSRSQLFRKIKALTGQSPSLFIRTIRLQKAKELLEGTEMNVSEVAYTVGFSAPAYFSDAFTETYGFRPSQVKK